MRVRWFQGCFLGISDMNQRCMTDPKKKLSMVSICINDVLIFDIISLSVIPFLQRVLESQLPASFGCHFFSPKPGGWCGANLQ